MICSTYKLQLPQSFDFSTDLSNPKTFHNVHEKSLEIFNIAWRTTQILEKYFFCNKDQICLVM